MEIVELDLAAVREHAGELAQLLLDAHASGMALGMVAPLTRERAAAEWERLVESRLVLGAVDDGTIVGAGCLAVGAGNGSHRGEIQRLAVRGDRRGGGVGGQLLDALVERARAAGLVLLWLTTHADTRSDSFYAARGWTRYGVVPRWSQRPDGEIVANAFFYLELPGTPAA
ncbi:MAG: GNAT family N-acetyltransferase [Actinomycetota bacterium]